MKRVLVTGANGFIGRSMVRYLKSRGCTVVALIKARNYDYSADWDEVVYGDIRTSVHVESDLKCDTVFHLAGKAHSLDEKVGEEVEYMAVNRDGTRNVLELAKRLGAIRFVYFSSIKAMGEIGNNYNEEWECIPETPYGVSKLEAERIVLSEEYAPHVAVIRPTMVYGPKMKGYLAKMMRYIRKGIFPPVSPKMENLRSMIHVEDLVRAAVLAAENPRASGQVYIVSDKKLYSTYEIYSLIRSALGKGTPVLYLPNAMFAGMAALGDVVGLLQKRRFLFDSDILAKMTNSSYYNTDKIRLELGFEPVCDLGSALPSIIEEMRW